MQALPDLTPLSHAQKDELIHALWAIVQAQAMQIQQLQARVSELEARLSLNSRNSSKPPSSDGLAKPAPKSLRPQGQRPVGGQVGHKGHTLRQSAQADHIITHPGPAQCHACQGPLNDYHIAERRQVFELPVLRAQVIEHQLLRTTCRCGAVHEGVFPPGVQTATQYGRLQPSMAHAPKRWPCI